LPYWPKQGADYGSTSSSISGYLNIPHAVLDFDELPNSNVELDMYYKLAVESGAVNMVIPLKSSSSLREL